MLRFIICLLTSLLLICSPAEFAGGGPVSAATSAAAQSKGSRKGSKKVASSKKGKSRTGSKKGKTRSAQDVRSEKKQNEADMRKTRQKMRLNAEETSRKLSQLSQVEGEIDQCNTRISLISSRLDTLNSRMGVMQDSIDAMNGHLQAITQRYITAIKRSQARRQQMSALAFIFSSDSFAQAWRRSRYLRQFARWRERKSKEIIAACNILEQKKKELAVLAGQANDARTELSSQRNSLVKKQGETEALVKELRGEGAALKQVMKEQSERAAALDRELDEIIAREIARQEAERKAAEEAARKAAEEAARKAAAAKAEADRKAAAAKAAADKAKAEADAKAKAEADRKAAAAQAAADKAKADAEAAAKKAKADADKAKAAATLHTPDAAADSGSASKEVIAGADFGDLKGRLPHPITGNYTIVKRFGRQKHPSLPHVETNNAGIDIQTSKGAAVRSVCDGVVSAVFRPDGYNTVVVIRHGQYMTVYANLGSISVETGQKVKAGQNIGKVFADPKDNGRSVLHFEIRHGRTKENPQTWLK